MIPTVSTNGKDAAADRISKLFVVGTERWVSCTVHNKNTQHQIYLFIYFKIVHEVHKYIDNVTLLHKFI